MKQSFLVIFFCLLLNFPALAGTAQYTYDSLNRLVRVQYDHGAVIEYTYDDAGNRTVQQVTATPYQPYQAPATSQTSGSTSPPPVIQNSPGPTRSVQ